MARTLKPRLRYFARFRGELGHLRAYVRHGANRIYITTPFVVNRDRLSKMDTEGYMLTMATRDDVRFDARLREYTQAVWRAAMPLIASGEFARTTGREFAKAVEEETERERTERARRGLTALGYDVDGLKEGWCDEGWHREDGTPIGRRADETDGATREKPSKSEEGESDGKL